MRKEALIIFIAALFFIPFVSSSYSCSDGSALIDDTDEIDLYHKKLINGVGLGLIYSDETAALQKYSATLLTNAYAFLLTQDDLSSTFEIDGVSKKITLINASDTSARIQLESSTDSFDDEQLKSISSLYLLLADSSGTYPNGTATVKGIVGEKSVELTNSAPSIISKINGKEYLLSLFSASDNNAVITVGTCANATITEIPDVIVNVSTNNSVINSSVNNSINSSMNVSANITEEKLNTTVNTNETIPTNTTEIIPVSTKSFQSYFIYIIITVILGCIILVVYFSMQRFLNRRSLEVERNH